MKAAAAAKNYKAIASGSKETTEEAAKGLLEQHLPINLAGLELLIFNKEKELQYFKVYHGCLRFSLG